MRGKANVHIDRRLIMHEKLYVCTYFIMLCNTFMKIRTTACTRMGMVRYAMKVMLTDEC